MALQDLSPAEMVEISTVWLTKPGTLSSGQAAPTVRDKLEAAPLLVGMLAPLEAIQQSLLGILGKVSPVVLTEIAAIEAEQLSLDGTHDSRNRFLQPFLGLVTELASVTLRPSLLELQGRLYPSGLLINRYKYEREAGEARLLEGRLTVGDTKLLDSISITLEGQSYTLLTLLQEMIEKAKRLGELEKIKQNLVEQAGAAPVPSTYELSNLWINRATTLSRLVDTAVELGAISPEVRDEILGPMYRLEQGAHQRRLAREKKKEPAKAPPGAEKSDPST
jgi:hypothetical protein